MSERTHIFLTGATGQVGAEVLGRLLRRGLSVTCLARAADGRSGAQRVRAALVGLGHSPEGDLTIVEGDLRHERLGLRAADWNRLAGGVDRIVHAAARIAFEATPGGEPFATNVGGTAQMVRLALEADASLFHVSTAYVCGAAAGFVPEEVRSEAPPFQNAYERSKWDAEHHVWSARAQGLRAAILRPSIVIGAAPDGRTVQFQGFYLLGWALSRICRRLARAGLTRPWLLEGITLPTDLTGPVNLVTVDYIGAAITHLALAKNSTGAVYHLTHPQPLSVAQVYGVLAEHYGFVVTPDAAGGAAPVSDRSTFTRSFQRVWDTLRPYFTTTPRFDTTHTRSALEPSGIAPPAVTPRLLHRMLDFADAQGFGRL